MFSSRVPSSRAPNRLTRGVLAARAAGRALIDLTVTNPTTVGIAYPDDLLRPLATPAALVYTPHPFGLPDAREAVARDYRRRGMAIDNARIVLTASTSEAYSLLFKLLCDAGDAVLVPVPSYPLFDHLTRLDDVRASTYYLEYHGRWCVDFDSVDHAWSPDVRALLGVSPNNPTGSILSGSELREMDVRCADRRAALILDEVFADYPLQAGPERAPEPQSVARALTFRLGGLSKSAGLPQVKLGWIAVEGPPALVHEALERLEIISDAYLSVSTPVQLAASALIGAAHHIRTRIRARVLENHVALLRLASEHPSIQVLPAEAGWSAVVRVPSTRSEEDLVLDLVDRDDVLVYPGFFFDLPHEAFLVVSLLPEPPVFGEGVKRMLERACA
jgi:aspartate/methionine/tyrosine aminotransferase